MNQLKCNSLLNYQRLNHLQLKYVTVSDPVDLPSLGVENEVVASSAMGGKKKGRSTCPHVTKVHQQLCWQLIHKSAAQVHGQGRREWAGRTGI